MSFGEMVLGKRSEPDFDNLLTVLERGVPARGTLFEFILHDRLHRKLAPECSDDPSDRFVPQRRVVRAFRNAGYDFANVLIPGSHLCLRAKRSARRRSRSTREP
jgi:hypothetical protein